MNIDKQKLSEALELVMNLFPGMGVILTIADDMTGDTVANMPDENLDSILRGVLNHHALKEAPTLHITPKAIAPRKEKLDALVVGDTVTRMLGGNVPMQLNITAIADFIYCGAWKFHRATGAEVDDRFGWDGTTQTGSFLKLD